MSPRRAGGGRQLGLFGPADPAGVGSAAVDPALTALGAALPETVRLGTSSWSFPGWAGLVYEREETPQRLARHGLAAYAQHPLLGCVGIDRTYYGPLPAAHFANLAAQVPASFRFIVKAHEACTWLRYPDLARYGRARGQANAHFLDPAYAAEQVVGPTAAGLGDRLGAVVFQFAPQAPLVGDGRRAFAERLQAFLARLPRGPVLAIEIRNRELLGPEYDAALTDTGAVHCLTAHPSMPPLDVQARVTGAERPGPLLIRWMLRPGLRYEAARARYQPFDRLVDPDAATRGTIAALVSARARRGETAYVTVNNKAEGSAPRSIERLATAIAAAPPEPAEPVRRA
jgi:uncharacterized protein YecE (DUF72 family)